MTIRNNYPNVRPSLVLDFARTQQLDPRITFTRDSIATRTNGDGYVERVANNIPRFDFDPITMESKGLIIEESRTNLLKYSEQINVSPWATIGANVAITANTTTAPDGTLNADSATTSTFASGDSFYQDVTATGNGTYTLSAFVKANTVSTITLAAFFTGSSTEGFSFGFNPNTGVITGGTGYIITYQNGWYRIYFTVTGTIALNTTLRWQIYLNTTGSVYVWGAQCEAGAFLTSYIPTLGTTVTRVLDSATMTGTNFTSWFNSGEGTLYGEAFTANSAITTNQVVANLSNSGGTSRHVIYRTTAKVPVYQVDIDGSLVAAFSGQTWTDSNIGKLSGSYKTDDYYFVYNNTVIGASKNLALPVVDRLILGDVVTNNRTLNGVLKKVAYYPYRLANTQVQALTTI